MPWEYTKYVRIQFFFQDIFLGAGFGSLWSTLLGWIILKVLSPSFDIIILSFWIGAVVGFIIGGVASIKFGKTTGSTQEHQKALGTYGNAIKIINLIISTLMGAIAGYLLFDFIGIILGCIGGFFVIYWAGFLLSFIYFIVLGKTFDTLLNLITLLLGSFYEKIPAVFNLIIDFIFTIIALILIKLKLTTKETLTGINDAMIQYDKGIKLDKRNKILEAVEAYKNAIRIDPNFPEFYNNIGYDYGLLGESEKEIMSYKKAIELKPDYIKAIHNFAISLIAKDKESEARKYLEKLKKIDQYTYKGTIDSMIYEIRKELNM